MANRIYDLTPNVGVAELLPSASYTADTYGVDVDMGNKIEEAIAILNVGSVSASDTLDVKIQHTDPLARGIELRSGGGTATVLRNGTDDNIQLAAAFTQSGARQIKYIHLYMKRVGTPAGHTNGIWLTIEGDSSGDPDGTAIANGTSAYIDPTTLGTTLQWITFTFATPVDVADATAYHVVLQGDYTLSAVNHVTWESDTVASGGNMHIFDAAWAATATENFMHYIEEYNFTDLYDEFDAGEPWATGTFTQVAAAGTSSIRLRHFKQIIRAYADVTGASVDINASLVAVGVNKQVT